MRIVMRGLWAAAAVLALAPAAYAVAIDWTFVGDPGNGADTTGFGAVGYGYQIGTYEVTNAQYAEFLNAKAASDPLQLYDTNMATGFGGITRSGSSGSYSYSAIAGRETLPVNWVSFYDAVRFANWIENGQGAGDTETGTYTLTGGTATPSNGATLTRNAGTTIALASEDEWYKAAYYDGVTDAYFDFPVGADSVTCAAPGATPNTANCGSAVGDLVGVGGYTGSASPSGAFDLGGNVWEWNEAIFYDSQRGIRGGSFSFGRRTLGATWRESTAPSGASPYFGFRLVAVPEPGSGVLLAMGLLGLARRRGSRG